MSPKVLMIAYHFPPLAGSSGIQRTLRFVQQLPRHGWEPVVLTVRPSAYERVSNDLMAEVPPDVVVKRSMAFDAARQLSIKGRYLAATSRPDRWMSWKYFGVLDGLQLIREHRPAAIWSTYPIPTAHVLGSELQRRSGLPWVADFRDPMAQENFPSDPVMRAQFHALEVRTVQQAALVTLTTPSATRSYRERYGSTSARIELLENGYDEASFVGARGVGGPLNPGAITLLHSGIVYPSERDPTQLFAAVARLRELGYLPPGVLKLRFRAAVHDQLLRELASRHGVQDCLETLPPVGYAEALSEMLRADALLVLQASNCNEQIPAKIYEYLRAGRPILGLSDPAGDTWQVLAQAGVDSQAALASADDIVRVLGPYLDALRAGRAPLPTPAAVRAASRDSRSERLAQLLDELTAR